MRILVAYASRHGATKGIAERIADTLGRRGHEVTLRSVTSADPIDGFDAFVIGSAAYLGGWLGEATAFVRGHRKALADRPVWLFSSGPTGGETVDASGRDVLTAAAPKEFGEFALSIQPRDERVFFGAFDPSLPPTGIAERLMQRFMRFAPAARSALPIGDFRDWPAIDAWADGIARDLAPVAAAS